jgi:hypothetical protein
MAGRVRANSAGPRQPFHSCEGSERARWDEEHLVDHAEPHDGLHRTGESGRLGAGEKAEPGRGAFTFGRVRLDTSGCLRISGLLVPVTRISWQSAPVPKPA